MRALTQMTRFIKALTILTLCVIIGFEIGYIYAVLYPPHYAPAPGTHRVGVDWYGCLHDMKHTKECWRV